MKKVVLLFILSLSFFINAQHDQLKEIDSIVNSKLSPDDPGLFVGIVKDGTIIYESYKGLASLQHQIEVNENSRSNIASTAKQFTALMILQLSMEKKLNLDDDIRDYLPKLYSAVKEKIKIRHLINHTSGIRDYADLMSIQNDPWWKRVGIDNDDVIEDLLEEQEDLAFAPGSRYMYSNSGYTLLSKIIAEVSGKSFHDYSKTFFDNLGMKNTSFLKNYMHVIPNQALPYSDWGDGVWQQYPMITNLYGDGFLFTTLKDQLVFEQAVQRADIDKNTLLIKSQKPIPNSEITTYGFGLELEDRLGYKAVHHSGSTGSYHSQMVRYPDQRLTVFVMSSNSRLWSGTIADEIASILLPQKEIMIEYDERIKDNSGLTDVNEIIGQYRSSGGYLIRIESKDNTIFWKNANNNPIELTLENNTIYVVKSYPKQKIGFYENELVLFNPTGKASVYKKVPYTMPTRSDLEGFTGQYFSKELDVSFEIKLTTDNTLMISRSDWKKDHEIQVINRDELLIFDYILRIQRDQFDRVTEILLTTNRVLNNKFTKRTHLKFQPKIETDNGTIQITTIGSRDDDASDILLTKNYPNGNEIWSQQFGGDSYDKASSIIATDDGYLIIGSTSSFGEGNYDMFVIKTDKSGRKVWQNTYGGFWNEYGYSIEKVNSGFILKGTKQKCSSNSDVLNRTCTTNVWFVTIDENGKEISNQILEEIKQASLHHF
ncbi:MAG: serine hydrolase domain-containing protein [Bacteroidota bacterium]